MKSHLIAAIALATTALVPISATAQQQPNQATGNRSSDSRSTSPAGQQQSALAPQTFVNQAAVSNMFEIESSRLAQDKSQNQRVQQFANRMVRDHSSAADRLKQAAQQTQGQKLTVPGKVDDEHQQKLERLRGLEGRRFDRTYVRMQVQGHDRAVDLFRRYSNAGTDGELREFAEQTLPTLLEHQQAILDIRDELFPNAATASRGDGQQDQQTGEAAQIRIQRTPPSVRVDQASPRVTVQQARPNVSVQQEIPEIVVHQPRPTVTIDIPQPRITLRMPEPQVDVSQAQPDVSVQQPKPQVQVQRSKERASVQVERDEPNVDVRRQQASVEVQRAQGKPVVRYEREDPRVVVNRAEGQPEVRIERTSPEQERTANQEQATSSQAESSQPRQSGGQSDQSQRAVRGGSTVAERESAKQRLGSEEERQTQGAANQTQGSTNQTQGLANQVPLRPVRVDLLEDMQVFNARGEDLGDVDAVVQDSAGRKYVVIAEGGFLGLGVDKVAFPADRFWTRGDRLMIRGVTDDDIDRMADYRDQPTAYSELAENATVRIRDSR
jgi:predicted outer membrane protein